MGVVENRRYDFDSEGDTVFYRCNDQDHGGRNIVTGQRDGLAERTVGRVFVDRIFIARCWQRLIGRPYGLAVGELRGRKTAGLSRHGHARCMNMGLNDKNLNRERDNNEQQRKKVRSWRPNLRADAIAFARELSSLVAIFTHSVS